MNVGSVFYELRIKQGIYARSLATGICPDSCYSAYERGIQIPDFLTVNAILERLGQGLSSLSVWLGREEIRYLKWRDMVCETIGKRDYGALRKLLEEECYFCPHFNKKLQNQFFLYAKGVLEDKGNHNLTGALVYYRKAYLQTASFLEETDWNKKKRPGILEAGIYCLYIRTETELGMLEAKSALERLELLYISLHSMPDREQMVKIFPLIICTMEEVEEKIGNANENYIRLTLREKRLLKAYELLKECRSLYHVNILLERLIRCRKYLQKDIIKLTKEKETIEDMYLFFDKKIDYNPHNLHGNVWMMVSMGEYLGNGRKQKGVTQEKISENICEPENYSRIESGISKPRAGNYKALAERINLFPRYYAEILDSENVGIHLLRMELSKEIYEGNYSKAQNLLDKLNEMLGVERERNKQFLEQCQALIDYQLGLVDSEERICDLKRILSYTINTEDVGKNQHTYTITEMNLINQLGCMYLNTKQYERAVRLFRGYLNDMFGENWNINQRFRETYTEALNLEKCYADLHCFDEANNICLRYINRALDVCYASGLDEYLVEYSYNLEHGDKRKSDEPKKLCELSVALSEIYGTDRRRNAIKAYFKKVYND